MSPTFTFSLKIWITSVVLGSLIADLPFLFQSNNLDDFIGKLSWVIFQMGVAAVLSVISLLLLWLFVHLLTRHGFGVIKTKIILSFIGLVLALAPLLWLIRGAWELSWTNSLFYMAYPVTIIAGIWFYKLKPVSDPEHTSSIA